MSCLYPTSTWQQLIKFPVTFTEFINRYFCVQKVWVFSTLQNKLSNSVDVPLLSPWCRLLRFCPALTFILRSGQRTPDDWWLKRLSDQQKWTAANVHPQCIFIARGTRTRPSAGASHRHHLDLVTDGRMEKIAPNGSWVVMVTETRIENTQDYFPSV